MSADQIKNSWEQESFLDQRTNSWENRKCLQIKQKIPGGGQEMSADQITKS